MWVMMNDAFLSIVQKDCARDELLVRARRPGDIEKIFPRSQVSQSLDSDYRYRARVKRAEVEAAMVGEVRRINYGNFKSSVQDGPLHDAYMRVWTAMSVLQPTRPYAGRETPDRRQGALALIDHIDTSEIAEADERFFRKAKVVLPKKKRGRPAKNLKGR